MSEEHTINAADWETASSTDSKDFGNITESTKDFHMLEKTDDDGLDVPEDSEWELVDVNDGSWDLDHGTSLHFDITLGWGQWKHTLCSVDYTNKVQLRDELDESEGNEADDESKSVTGSDSDDHPERRND